MTLCGKQAEGEQKDSSGAEAPFSPQTGRNSGTLACNLPPLATWATPSISLIKTDYSKRLLLLSDILVPQTEVLAPEREAPLIVSLPSHCKNDSKPELPLPNWTSGPCSLGARCGTTSKWGLMSQTCSMGVFPSLWELMTLGTNEGQEC